ncbi:MAG: glycosyltransferase [Synergistetes bacterium]|nr:glycosyltransferase [Synergistota bacterium]MDK2870776.1 hypothetical protein [bacterium]
MKIAFYINSLDSGGGERVVSLLSLALNGDFKKYILLNERVIKYPYEGKLHVFCDSIKGKKLRKLWMESYIPSAFALGSFLKREAIDVCISMDNYTNKINILSLSRAKKVLRFGNYFSWFGKKRWSFKPAYYRWLYSRADSLIAISKGVAEELCGFGLDEEKVRVIYNPILLKEILLKCGENLPINLGDYILNVGRLHEQKGQWHALRIFRELKKFFPYLKLVILGEGPLKDELVKLSQSLSFKTFVWDRDVLSEDYDVYFMGFEPNPFKYMRHAKISLFASLWEGLPNALIEALACGSCVVSADCRSGPREILAPDTDFKREAEEPEFVNYGILMPVLERQFMYHDEPLTGRERKWVKVLCELLDRPEIVESYRKKAFLRAKDFDLTKIEAEWRKLISDVLS